MVLIWLSRRSYFMYLFQYCVLKDPFAITCRGFFLKIMLMMYLRMDNFCLRFERKKHPEAKSKTQSKTEAEGRSLQIELDRDKFYFSFVKHERKYK